jgi:hypothetical protein
MPSQITGAVEQWLKNKGKRFTKALGLALFCVVVAIDVGVIVSLREVPALIGGHRNESDAWLVEGRDGLCGQHNSGPVGPVAVRGAAATLT